MDSIEARIQYQFRQPELLEMALTHVSIRRESRLEAGDNQRLEFLGDAVLQVVVAEALFRQFSHSDEGVLTKLRARLVSTKALARLARQLDLGRFVRLGKGEESTGGRERESTLADAFEAVVGAIYMDGGLKAARYMFLRVARSDIQALITRTSDLNSLNPKGQLQELLQGIDDEAPSYEIVAASGPDHHKHFDAVVSWRGHRLGQGTGPRKKDAEAAAAQNALAGQELKTLLAANDLPAPAQPPETFHAVE